MTNRWIILAVLFLARTSMAFQFQSIAAISPLLAEGYGLSLADIGLLIGLYMAPGVVIALPGGVVAARFGDKRVVGVSMGLTLVGMALILVAPGWPMLVAGRVVAGVGGITLNIVLTKMVADWFAGRELGTAMAIFINSWPVGITLALLTLPWLADAGGLTLVWAAVLALIVLGLVLLLAVYPTPPDTAAARPKLRLGALPGWPLFLAGTIWAIYNTALAMVFSFGPALLDSRGLPLTLASSLTSVFIVVFSILVPTGGFLADRTGRPDTMIVVSFLAFILLMPLALVVPIAAVPVVFILVGATFGLCAGPIISLPATILSVETRALGMGIFYAIYYAWMMLAPVVAGAIADWTGQIGIVFLFAAVLLVIGIGALALLRRVLPAT